MIETTNTVVARRARATSPSRTSIATAFALFITVIASTPAHAQAPTAPIIAAAWDAPSAPINTSRRLTVTLTNPNAVPLTGVGFNAGTVPVGFNATSLAGTCLGTSYNGGTRQLAMTGFTLAPAASCTASLDLTVTIAGSYTFTTGTPFATGPQALTGTAATTGVLTVFDPAAVPTLSEWAMILFGTVLAGGAALYLQRRRMGAWGRPSSGLRSSGRGPS